MEGVKYSVFGCGNSDWVRTFQRVPQAIDTLLEERGGKRLNERGVGDAQAADFFQNFDEWEAKLWSALATVRCDIRSEVKFKAHMKHRNTALRTQSRRRLSTASR